MDLLADMNASLEAGRGLPGGVLEEWLWRSRADEAVHPDVLLNRSHLLGLLVCRHRSLSPAPDGATHDARMTVVKKPVAAMTWRELKDTVANLQIEWPRFIDRLRANPRARENLLAVRALLERCLCRFGELAWGKFAKEVLDDPQDTQPAFGDDSALALTPSSLRRMLGTFLILCRHTHLLAAAETVPRRPEGPHPITKYQHEASMDKFHELCMYHSVPVAAVLNYKQDFQGMFNSVSQVAFFHNSSYERTLRCSVDAVATAPPIHVLPSVMELHPEIPVVFEEDAYNPTESKGWYWLLLPGRIYLVTPEPRVLYSEDVLALLDVYRDTLDFLD